MHEQNGRNLRDAGKLQEALAEFQRAAEIDPTSAVGAQEARRTDALIKEQARHDELTLANKKSSLKQLAGEAQGPVELELSKDAPVTLRMSTTADLAYQAIGKIAGFNVLFDPDYKPQHTSIELTNVTAREALNMLALESKTFWQPLATNTILVAADTTAKRKEFENNVMKTFYVRNLSTPAELQEAANTIRGMLDLNRIQLIPAQNAMVLRGTKEQLVLAQKLLTDIDKPKAEVMIEVAVMEVSRDRVRTLGLSPPTSASIVMSAPTSTAGGASGGGSTLSLNQFAKLTGNNFLVTVPGATLQALMSDSNTKVIQNPQIRALDNEKASLKIGDRVPVATGSFAAGIGGGGVSPLVNTQFQYLDVGVNIDITPHIHSEREVTLKMSLEISTVTGEQNIGGVSQPVIGQRRIEHETRLGDGDVNLVGGILEDTETQALSGYPWISKLPVLKYLLGTEDKQRHEREIVFAITPHIVRAQEVDEQNERLLDVGTGNTLGIRRKEAAPAKPGSPAAPAAPGAPAPAPPQTSVPAAPGQSPTPQPPAPSPGPANP
jgi:general secretion pathway protein D